MGPLFSKPDLTWSCLLELMCPHSKQKGHVDTESQLSMLSQILGSIDLRIFGHFPCLSVCVANSTLLLGKDWRSHFLATCMMFQGPSSQDLTSPSIVGLQNLLICGNRARDHGFLLIW